MRCCLRFATSCPWDRLLAEGKITPAEKRPSSLPRPLPSEDGQSISGVLEEVREGPNLRPERLYVDASALVKLVVEEPESQSLFAAVESSPITSSVVVATLEVRLATRRSVRGAERVAEEVLSAVSLVRLTDELARQAGRLEGLRSLEVIHLASALSVETLDGIVAYDRRLADAAARAGLRVLTPS